MLSLIFNGTHLHDHLQNKRLRPVKGKCYSTLLFLFAPQSCHESITDFLNPHSDFTIYSRLRPDSELDKVMKVLKPALSQGKEMVESVGAKLAAGEKAVSGNFLENCFSNNPRRFSLHLNEKKQICSTKIEVDAHILPS